MEFFCYESTTIYVVTGDQVTFICIYSLFNNINEQFSIFTLANSIYTRDNPYILFKLQLIHDVKSHDFIQGVLTAQWIHIGKDLAIYVLYVYIKVPN